MKKNYNSRWMQFSLVKIAVLTYFLLLNAGLALAQTTVKGVVTDENNEGLPGVSVVIEGTTQGTVTDFDGNYSITVESSNTLLFSFTGYETTKILVGNQSTIDVQLQPSTEFLSEVVVTGYSSQRKADITGAVSVVDTDALESTFGSSVGQKLEGRSTGITVNSPGTPGGNVKIRVRGFSTLTRNSDPLYVIDGVPVVTKDLSFINPSDIKSVQILKDASASAIYGARASNGVIIVTTKSGKKGKVKVTYNASFGTQTPTGGADEFLIVDPFEYAKTQRLSYANAERNGGASISKDNFYYDFVNGAETLPDKSYIDPEIGTIVDGKKIEYSYPNYLEFDSNKSGTNWWKELMRRAPMTEHNLSVSGGSENATFNVGVGYLNQEGTMIHTNFERFNIRANSKLTLGKFTFGESFTLTKRSDVGVSGENQTEDSPVTQGMKIQTIVPVYDISGEQFAGAKSVGQGNARNPVARQYRIKDNVRERYNVLGSFYGEMKILESLKIKSQLGIDLGTTQKNSFNFPSPEESEPNFNDSFTELWDRSFAWTWTNTISFNKTINNKHTITALAGTEAIQSQYRKLESSIANYFNRDISNWFINTGLADQESLNAYSEPGGYSLFSIFGKVGYGYDDKYLFDATIRRDGSSNFGDEKYGVFPSFSLGWRISNEKFMDNIAFVDDLKIRGGWGQVGNQDIPFGNQFDKFTGNTQGSFYALNGENSLTTGFALTSRGDPRTTWETKTTQNIGFDLGLFDGKLNIVLDLYSDKIDDLLYDPRPPATTGFSDPAFVNTAKMTNKGVDLSISYSTEIKDEIGFNSSITFSHYKNEITALSDGLTFFDDSGNDSRIGPYIRNKVGSSIGSFFGYQVDRIFQESDFNVDGTLKNGIPAQAGAKPGRLKWKDTDGNGEINGEDRTIVGNPHPKFVMGLNLGADYKGFDFSMFWFTSVGNEIYNYNKLFSIFQQFSSNADKSVLTETWTPTNTGASLPAFDHTDTFSRENSSFYVEDGSYLRLRSLQIGYTFPAEKLKGAGISRLRLYAQGQNLLTLTKYSGIDPVISDADSDKDTLLGVDLGNYPTSSIWSVGLNVEF